MRDVAAWTTGSALIAAALCCAGCFYQDVTTVTLRDPGGARLSTNDENGARVVLPEGRRAITVDVARRHRGDRRPQQRAEQRGDDLRAVIGRGRPRRTSAIAKVHS